MSRETARSTRSRPTTRPPARGSARTCRAGAGDARSHRPMPTERSAHRVFVVDDDPGLLYLLTFSLTADGHLVDPFDHGGDVCTRAAREQPDVIVLDGMLPDRDGLGILHELKGDPAT